MKHTFEWLYLTWNVNWNNWIELKTAIMGYQGKHWLKLNSNHITHTH